MRCPLPVHDVDFHRWTIQFPTAMFIDHLFYQRQRYSCSACTDQKYLLSTEKSLEERYWSNTCSLLRSSICIRFLHGNIRQKPTKRLRTNILTYLIILKFTTKHKTLFYIDLLLRSWPIPAQCWWTSNLWCFPISYCHWLLLKG